MGPPKIKLKLPNEGDKRRKIRQRIEEVFGTNIEDPPIAM